MFRKFVQSRSGNFAILAGVAIVPLCLAAGLAIDYSRHLSAQKHLQEMVDATSLSLAASREKDQSKLERLATDFLAGNQNVNRVQHVRLDQLKSTDDDVDIAASGTIPTTFMALAGYETLNVRASALAERAVNGQVEVSLILDNTFSMSDSVGGKRRIDVLRTASKKLIDELLKEADGAARIAIVPYADYVNVGTQYRGAPWLKVAADYSTSSTSNPPPRTCERRTTRTRCVRNEPTYSCPYYVDGVEKPKTCGGGCAPGGQETYDVEPYDYCTGGGEPKTTYTHFTWHGCVKSRIGSDNRLHNKNPTTVQFEGILTRAERHMCVTPIVELTSNKQALKSAIDGLITNREEWYEPLTYIPSGLIWGYNTLAPGHPLTGPSDYDPKNQRPRKVAVLMTDGANTMRFVPSGGSAGTHASAMNRETGVLNQAQVAVTDADTLAICRNMKAQGIEIFTVAFMVEEASAKSMLESCSSDPATHYFDASSSDDLLAAFEDIGNSLRVVRLAR
ncbi:TadE/TadG family type IV pilus assembly protein [Aliihoeflea sp. PC F10.4]